MLYLLGNNKDACSYQGSLMKMPGRSILEFAKQLDAASCSFADALKPRLTGRLRWVRQPPSSRLYTDVLVQELLRQVRYVSWGYSRAVVAVCFRSLSLWFRSLWGSFFNRDLSCIDPSINFKQSLRPCRWETCLIEQYCHHYFAVDMLLVRWWAPSGVHHFLDFNNIFHQTGEIYHVHVIL